MRSTPHHHKRWKYKNTLLLILSLAVLFFLADSFFVKYILDAVSRLYYIGALVTGFFFVSTFTITPASILFYHLAAELNPVSMALVGAVGAVLGDFVIFRFFRDHVLDELKPIYMKLGGSHLSRLLSTPYFGWFAPLLGALIIASPFPDELGIGLLGIARLKNWQFVAISYVMNAIGILLIAGVRNQLQ